MCVIINTSFNPLGSQVSRGTHRSSLRGRKRLKERALKSNYFRSKIMAQVTYRGVKYDTRKTRVAMHVPQDLTYRGIRHRKLAGVQ